MSTPLRTTGHFGLLVVGFGVRCKVASACLGHDTSRTCRGMEWNVELELGHDMILWNVR